MELLDNLDMCDIWNRTKELIQSEKEVNIEKELKQYLDVKNLMIKDIKGIHHRAYYIGTYEKEEIVFSLYSYFKTRKDISEISFGPSYIAPKYYDTPGWWFSIVTEGRKIELFIIKHFGKWINFDEKTRYNLMSHCAIELCGKSAFYSYVNDIKRNSNIKMLMLNKEEEAGNTYAHFLNCRNNKVIELIYTHTEKSSKRQNYFYEAISQKEKDKEIIQKVKNTFDMSEEERKEWQNTQIKRVYDAFYGKPRYELNPDKVNIETIGQLPFITREMIKKSYPLELRKKESSSLVRYGESTGTTKNPISAYYTECDWHYNNAVVAGFLSNILDRTDRVMVIVPYSLAMVAQDVDRALESIGAMVIPIGTIGDACNIDRLISILKSVEVTSIICSPTRALYIAYEIKKRGYNAGQDFFVNKIFCVGEGTSPAKTKLIEEIWQAKAYPMYGMTETNTLAMSCENGKLHLAENKAFFEVIDENGNNAGFDKRGELVVTTFFEGMPLIRYKTGDICTIHLKKCSCGLTLHTIEHHGRKTDMIELGNNQVSILDLEQIIINDAHCMFYNITVSERGVKIGVGIPELDTVRDKLEKDFDEKFGIIPIFESISEDIIAERIKGMVKPSIASIYKG